MLNIDMFSSGDNREEPYTSGFHNLIELVSDRMDIYPEDFSAYEMDLFERYAGDPDEHYPEMYTYLESRLHEECTKLTLSQARKRLGA